MSADTLTQLQIVPPTVKLADDESRRKYQHACDVGSIECPTSRVMFLGDRGVGKTCTKRLLLGLEHVADHHSTLGIRTHVTETRTVNEDWKEVNDDYIKEYGNSELKRALAYFVAFKDDIPFLNTMRTKLWNKFISIGAFLLALFCVSLVCYCLVYIEDLTFRFTPALLACTIMVGFCTRNVVTGFNIGNGLCMVLVFAYYWTNEAGLLLVNVISDQASRVILLAGISGFMGGFVGFLLALGIGGGMSMAMCLMEHSPGEFTIDRPVDRELQSYNESVVFSVFVISCFLGIFSQNLLLKQMSEWVSNIIAPVVFVLSAIVTKAFTSGLTIVHFYISGFLFGTMFVFGQKKGRQAAWLLRIGHERRLLTDTLGFLIGIFYGYYLGWTAPEIGWHLLFGMMGCAFCIACELHRMKVKRRDSMPVSLIVKMKNDGHKHWPVKLYLLDCAGNSVYHNVHHVFMSRHSIYLIVFRMDMLRDQPFECVDRILYWINSVFAHARHQDAKVFLVASHRMKVPDPEERARLLTELSEKMRPFRGRLGKNKSKNYYAFSLDNCERDDNDEDVELLKAAVWDSAMSAEYRTLPNRVTWFAFLDIIRQIRNEEADEAHPRHVISCIELWDKVKEPCKLKTETDFYRMLRYYNDCGEIYYDSRDAVLCKYVVLNPQLMVDAVSVLLRFESTVQDLPDRFVVDHEQLKKKGIISFRLLKEHLKDFHMDTRQLVRLLQSLDILIPLSPSAGLLSSTSDQYIVNFMLPLRPEISPIVKNPDRILIFDFNYFYPEPVFLRLLAKCYQMSFTTTEVFSFIISQHNIKMFKDEGLFYFGNGIQYTISLHRADSSTNQIWLRIRALESAEMRPDIYDFMQQMDALLRSICFRYFEFLEYECKVVCDCSIDLCSDVRIPAMADIDTFTIVDYRQGVEGPKEFPERSQSYICEKDPSRTVTFNSKPMGEFQEAEGRPHLPEGRIKAFISCCAEDRTFVQSEILPYIENAEALGKPANHNVTALVNYYDNPNPNGSFWSAHAINQEYIRYCRCVIAIFSKKYLNSPEYKDIHSALKLRVPIIPVYRDNCDRHPDLENLAGIHYPPEPELLAKDFYVPLIRSVRKHCDRYEPEPEPPGRLERFLRRFIPQPEQPEKPTIL